MRKNKIKTIDFRQLLSAIDKMLTPRPVILLILLYLFCPQVQAAEVRLEWIKNTESDLAGYRIYYGPSSGSYEFSVDVGNWPGYTISGLETGTTYYFAITAYDTAGNESEFSAEISYAVPMEDTDQDGMPDAWERRFGLDPYVDDAAEDPDEDGVSNIDEYHAGTDPTLAGSNRAPRPPILFRPLNDERVETVTVFQTEPFYDPDVDDIHAGSRWQIFRVKDNVCVFDRYMTSSLTSLTLSKLILDADTEYSWKIQFVDNHGNASEWSEPGSFSTDTNDGDANNNGIPDHQEADPYLDLDRNDRFDKDQDDIRCVKLEGGNMQIGLSIRDADMVQSIAALESENPANFEAESASNGIPESFPYGLISFKLVLSQPGEEVAVTIYLSTPAPVNGRWYKYDPMNGTWQDYTPHTEFSEERRAAYLTLQDGGVGDADGVENGIIVDPIGLGIAAETVPSAINSPGNGSNAACFISSVAHLPATEPSYWIRQRIREIERKMIF